MKSHTSLLFLFFFFYKATAGALTFSSIQMPQPGPGMGGTVVTSSLPGQHHRQAPQGRGSAQPGWLSSLPRSVGISFGIYSLT